MAHSHSEDTTTIAALATASAPAGVGIIRVSGPLSKDALSHHFRSKENPITSHRKLIFGNIIENESKASIDHGLAVYMPGPNSFTGEDIAEFQFHGGPLIARKILESLFAFGIHPAEPGEFSKRAFLNGKIDLLQAESIADVIAATNESALKVAQNHLEGKLSDYIDNIAEPLRNTLAQVEAHLDFPEEDIEPSALQKIQESISGALTHLVQLLDSYSYGQKIREGYKVLLCGPPNAGKSSLLNTLLGRERAIVTDISGTTRDLIEEECFIGQHRFVLCDSAGITESTDRVERLGVELSLSRLSWADLVIVTLDSTDDMSSLNELLSLISPQTDNTWGILNKSDLNGATSFPANCSFQQTFSLSTKTTDGIDALRDALVEEIDKNSQSFGEVSVVLTHARQKEQTQLAIHALEESLKLILSKAPLELLSEEIRTGLRALEEMVGKTYSDDILGRIFAQFCIGK